jgi:hypothetical protein
VPRWRDSCFEQALKRAELSRLENLSLALELFNPLVISGLRQIIKIGPSLA